MAFEAPIWWPFEFEDALERHFLSFRNKVLSDQVALNTSLVKEAADQMAASMVPNIRDVVARDGLPHLAHAIVGWGDGRLDGLSLCDRIAEFATASEAGPVVPQCDPEGDFHPWQSFAYSAMAGCDGDRPLGTFDFSMRDMIRASRVLQTRENRELGHLLFALATYDPDPNGPPFDMGGVEVPVAELPERAVEAHIYGGFQVCRKFHLTEGLCAAVARIPGFEAWRPHAEGFLDGQMTVLEVFALIMELAGAVERGGGDRAALARWRNALRIGDNLENHIYYAGHLVELAALARMHGYTLRSSQLNAANYVVNATNRTVMSWQKHLNFRDSFLGLGHFRRASTLWMALENGEIKKPEQCREVLRRFAVDFDATDTRVPAPEPVPLPEGSVYAVARTVPEPRPIFAQMIAAYEKTLPPAGLRTRGTFDHFRRIGPPHWPRSVHYELLDHEQAIGVEIHLEKDEVAALKPVLEAIHERAQVAFPEARIVFDETWYRGRGRVVLGYHDRVGPEAIAKEARRFIDMTFPQLDQAISEL